jgi:pre-mRNA-processing factor 6
MSADSEGRHVPHVHFVPRMQGVGFKRSFAQQREGPVNYIAGRGRGATGFTTRSDIGPARVASDAAFEKTGGREGQREAPVNYVAGRGRGANSIEKHPEDDDGKPMEGDALDEGDAGNLFADSV